MGPLAKQESFKFYGITGSVNRFVKRYISGIAVIFTWKEHCHFLICPCKWRTILKILPCVLPRKLSIIKMIFSFRNREKVDRFIIVDPNYRFLLKTFFTINSALTGL